MPAKRDSSTAARKSGSVAATAAATTTTTTTTTKSTAKTANSSGNKKNDQLSWFDRLLSANPQRRTAEKFFFKWLCAWLLYFGGIVVFKTYEDFDEWSYMKVGAVSGLPPILLPLFFPKLSGEEGIAWYNRFTTKANAFVFIWSWIGNYFWTHYFYHVLGAGYTFPGLCLNGVPFALYWVTHSYFLLYHLATAMAFRALWRQLKASSRVTRWALSALLSLVLGYTTAVMEVWSISSFPYYTYPNKYRMWVIGSVFYSIDFLISYPYFASIDEDIGGDDDEKNNNNKRNNNIKISSAGPFPRPFEGTKKTLREVVIEGLAYAMLTSIMLDAWRISLGAVNPITEEELAVKQHAVCLPWW